VRFSLLASLVAIILTLLIGTFAGALSGYFSGWADRIIMRTSDLFLAVPGLFFILGLRVLYPVNLTPLEAMMMLVVTFVVISWAYVSRVVRGQVLAIKEREHVLAARSMGASDFRILLHHVLPLCRSVLAVQATFFLPLFLVAEITLSFLGVGVQEPAVSLGLLIRDAASLQALLTQHWKWAPALVAFLLIFGMNFWADRGRLVGKVRAQWW
jgi:peptide/nickel transport system permease protein